MNEGKKRGKLAAGQENVNKGRSTTPAATISLFGRGNKCVDEVFGAEEESDGSRLGGLCVRAREAGAGGLDLAGDLTEAGIGRARVFKKMAADKAQYMAFLAKLGADLTNQWNVDHIKQEGGDPNEMPESLA